MLIGTPVQTEPTTPGLVQFNVFPPAGPETMNVPAHSGPKPGAGTQVNVPEKLFEVTVPVTVPLKKVVPRFVAVYAPLTPVPAWVSDI